MLLVLLLLLQGSGVPQDVAVDGQQTKFKGFPVLLELSPITLLLEQLGHLGLPDPLNEPWSRATVARFDLQVSVPLNQQLMR